ncbi:MAG: chloride channel protein [Bacteroidia bacterium]|nr:chloride channel protein [Bacteroidia bacterium]MCZ2278217.1 chloride channel protein [Bacteroidia bacterium]
MTSFLRAIQRFNLWRKQHISQSAFLLMAAAVVGVLGGVAASVLKKSTHLVADLLLNEIQGAFKYLLYFGFPVLGLILTTLYLKIFIRKHSFRQGISPLIGSVLYNRSKLDFHNIYNQIITSALTVGMGGSAGLESPSVASGAAVGSTTGRLFGLKYRETTLLLACGGAAGISGAFDSPVAGMLFAIEVLLPSFSIPAITPLLIASALSSVVSWMIYNKPLFLYVTDSWTTDGLWVYILFGIVSGFYTVYYAFSDEWIHNRLASIKNTWTKIAVGGILLGILVALFPALFGEGYINIQPLLEGNYNSLLAHSMFHEYSGHRWILIGFAVLTLIGKTIACSLTMGSGGNGGMFGPSVVIGGLAGFIFAFTFNQTGLLNLNVSHFMIAGMAAAVSGVMHAPLTGIFLSVEITSGYSLMVPLMVVSAISYFINKKIRTYSIYTKPFSQPSASEQYDKHDSGLLSQIRLQDIIQKNFTPLSLDDTPSKRKEDIIHSERSVFPVTDHSGKLIGTIQIDEILEMLLNTESHSPDQSIAELVQPVTHFTTIHTPLHEVLQHMDTSGRQILPVIDSKGIYIGFISKDAIFRKYRDLLSKQNQLY